MQKILGYMPAPNDFTVGDGLNTAGYTWSRPVQYRRQQFNVRLDHAFSTNHRFTMNYTYETDSNTNYQFKIFPTSPQGPDNTHIQFASMGLTSTFRGNIVNELRFGGQRPVRKYIDAYETPDMPKYYPQANGIGFYVIPTLTTQPLGASNPFSNVSPLYQFSDSVSWIKGKHSFKTGGEYRFSASLGRNTTNNVLPMVQLGAGGVPVTGITSAAIAGLGANQAAAQNLLIDLSGSVNTVLQGFDLAPGSKPPYTFQPSIGQIRHYERNELSGFFKDDFKATNNLTLYLGVRYDFFGVVMDRGGLMAEPVGGTKGLFGISGTGWEAEFNPGVMDGSMTQIVPVGNFSVNPGQNLYGNDLNNFAPAVGFSWNTPYFGKDETVVRAGYAINYVKDSFRLYDGTGSTSQGVRDLETFRSASALNLSNVQLPLPVTSQPFALVPFTSRTTAIYSFQNDLRTPYIQNWNFSIQRAIKPGVEFSARYVGSKGTKLIRGANIDEVNIFENGILDAFQATAAGGNSPLFDRMLKGLNLGLGAINGTNVTGSASLRANSTTAAFLANNNVGALANYFNTSNAFTGAAGGLLRNGNLPENFIVANPQYANTTLTGNFANSTYHALQLEVVRRFAKGWTVLANYTWSKSLGEEEGASQTLLADYRTIRNRSWDKRLLNFNRPSNFGFSGTYELPFGPGRLLTSNSRVLNRLMEKWQFGGIMRMLTGAPFSIASPTSSFNQQTAENTASVTGPFSKNIGQVTRVKNGVIYFQGLRQVPEPAIAALTTQQGLQSNSKLFALADSNGQIVLINPAPGTYGNFRQNSLTGPGEFDLDLNLVKRVVIREAKTLELRIDAINAPNHTNFGIPDSNINSTTFGQITTNSLGSASTGSGATGNRIIVLNMRLNF
jgi:hypothetical protein